MEKLLLVVTFVLNSLLIFCQILPFEDCLIVDFPFNGNANDQTQYVNHGIVHGATLTTDRFGTAASAYEFDGKDDWIEFDTTGVRNEIYTFSLWAKTYSIPVATHGYIALSIGQNGGDQQIIFTFYPAFGQVGWGCSSYSNGFPTDTTIGAIGDTSLLHHLASGRNNIYTKFYLDGQLFGVMPSKGTLPDYGASTIASVGSRWGGYQFFHGKIDDVKIYKCELSDSQILDLYNSSTNLPNSTTEGVERDELVISSFGRSLLLKSNKQLKDVHLEVYNSSGFKVFEKQNDIDDEFELSMNLSEGMYFINAFSINLSVPVRKKVYLSH